MAAAAASASAAAGQASGPGFTYSMAVPHFYQPAIAFQAGGQPAGATTQVRVGGGSRSGVCASRHMAAEQRRRARINERLEALRGLVPHSARANTAAFLTEVFDYIMGLHKQLERLGAEVRVIDLNIAASEGKGGVKPVAKYPGKGGRQVRKRSRDSKSDDESEVESEDPDSSADCEHDEADQKPNLNTVSAPSLFDPAVKKTPEHTMSGTASGERERSSSHDEQTRSAFTTPAHMSFGSDTGPSVDLVLLNSQPGRQSKTPEPCDTHIALGIGQSPSVQQTQSKSRPREIQPAPVPLLPTIHHNAVVAANAAVADAAAAAQSWGMAAAVAQVQAQAAAQVLAQAQAQAQAQMHVQAQAQAQAQAQTRTTAPAPKRRRRSSAAEGGSTRQRNTAQAVVRPIALKPQR